MTEQPASGTYIETLRLMTQAWQCDHLGHVNVSFYMGWLGDAAFAIGAMHGWPREQMLAEQAGVAAVRAEVDYQAELRGGDMVRMESNVESIGERKIVFRHRLIRVGDDRQTMAARLTGVCIDLVQRRARPFPAAFVARIAETFGIHPVLPKEAAA
jgi:acyl-CoA thioester hydrolase